jgi:mannosyltransferase OCH1-like enzyme
MIPKTLHFIWWQGIDKIPDKFSNNINTWRLNNKNYNIFIWDEQSIKKLVNKNYNLNHLNSFSKMIQKIDYSKYLILYKYGGCYIDIDMICYDNIDKYIDQNKINVSLFYFTNVKIFPVINNGFIACPKNCEEIYKIISKCVKNANNSYLLNELTVMYTTGPIMFNNEIENSENINILSSEVIYETNIQEYGVNKNKGLLACHLHEFSWINSNILLILKLHYLIKSKFDVIIITIMIILLLSFYFPKRLLRL